MTVLLVDDHEGIRTLTLHRPERRNALSPELVAALDAALKAADADSTVRCIVVTGATSPEGKPTFCAGGDLGGMVGEGIRSFQRTNHSTQPEGPTREASWDVGFYEQHLARAGFAELLLTFRRLRTPTVAAVDGIALGGGFGLVLACDLAVCADDARLGTPEVKRGLFPMMIAALIDEVLPKKQAMELMLCGGEIDGRRAVDLGIVNRSVPSSLVLDEAKRLAATIAAQSSAVLALGKRAVHAQRDMPFEQKLMFLRDQLTLNLQLDDAAEGVAAFVGKRAPVWKGR